MRDWRCFVAAHLEATGLSPELREDIVAELAGHLEEVYKGWMRCGAAPGEAAQHALSEVPNWVEFSCEIRSAVEREETMKHRIRTLWIPGFFCSMVAFGALLLLNTAGLRPHVAWVKPGWPLVFYIPWLAILPLVGGLAAFLARRTGALRPAQIVAAAFPALAVSALLAASLLIGLILDLDSHVRMALKLYGLGSALFVWGAVPGSALLIGAFASSGLAPRTEVR